MAILNQGMTRNVGNFGGSRSAAERDLNLLEELLNIYSATQNRSPGLYQSSRGLQEPGITPGTGRGPGLGLTQGTGRGPDPGINQGTARGFYPGIKQGTGGLNTPDVRLQPPDVGLPNIPREQFQEPDIQLPYIPREQFQQPSIYQDRRRSRPNPQFRYGPGSAGGFY